MCFYDHISLTHQGSKGFLLIRADEHPGVFAQPPPRQRSQPTHAVLEDVHAFDHDLPVHAESQLSTLLFIFFGGGEQNENENRAIQIKTKIKIKNTKD